MSWTKAQALAMRKRFGLGEFRHKKPQAVKRPKAVRRSTRKKRAHFGGSSMARKKYHSRGRSRGGLGGMNKWLKVLAFSAGAAIIAPRVLGSNISPQVASAAGGFAAGGPIGAAVGFIAGPTIGNMVGGLTGTSSSSSGFVN